MAKSISIDPLTRIEGHLAVRVEVENNQVVTAYSSGEMFRGFEVILKGRHPMDAQQITQRICGVCPISHGIASCLAQDDAYGVSPPKNGRLIRNLILGANFIQSHIIHFYQLSALDFIDITAITEYKGKDLHLNELKNWVKTQLSSKVLYPAAPFLPRYQGDYLEDTDINITAIKHYLDALDMRALAHEMAALFGGKLPHATTLLPGGVTEKVTPKNIAAFKSKLKRIQHFIDECYLPDIIEIALAFPQFFKNGKGCGNFLAYGVFQESENLNDKLFPSGVLRQNEYRPLDISNITEEVRYSLFSSPSGLRPDEGMTTPAPHKVNAYSWLKAPRYDGQAMEVGPLARILISYSKGGNPQVKKLTDTLLSRLYSGPEILVSTLGRHAARAIEAKIIADRCAHWLDELVPDAPTFHDFTIPKTGRGIGLNEAPRGALGHWLDIRDHKINNYQCVVPTTWNCSPRDDQGIPGPVEQALVGTYIQDNQHPLEASRVVRSFDPCLACAVH